MKINDLSKAESKRRIKELKKAQKKEFNPYREKNLLALKLKIDKNKNR